MKQSKISPLRLCERSAAIHSLTHLQYFILMIRDNLQSCILLVLLRVFASEAKQSTIKHIHNFITSVIARITCDSWQSILSHTFSIVMRHCGIPLVESWQSTISNLALKIPLFESFKRNVIDCHSPSGLRNDAVANALIFRLCERSEAIHNPAHLHCTTTFAKTAKNP